MSMRDNHHQQLQYFPGPWLWDYISVVTVVLRAIIGSDQCSYHDDYRTSLATLARTPTRSRPCDCQCDGYTNCQIVSDNYTNCLTRLNSLWLNLVTILQRAVSMLSCIFPRFQFNSCRIQWRTVTSSSAAAPTASAGSDTTTYTTQSQTQWD